MAISVSFLCSVMEAALLSITPSYIAQLEDKKPKLYKQVSNLKQNIDNPLAAILSLNTIAHTVGATGVGAQVADMYGQSYIGLASGVMTIAILVLSEILPKSIGAKYWKKLIPSMVVTLHIMMFLLAPFLWVSKLITRWFDSSGEESDIKDEIKALAKMGRDEKIIDENKYRVIANVVNLQEVKVKDIMTPRIVVHSVPPRMTIKAFDQFISTSPFSRFPIIDEQQQLFLGYIHKSSSYKAKDDELVDDYARPMRSYSTEARLEDVLSKMIDDRNHMALVIDQFENWAGIVTLEDIIETILGKEIVDETDQVPDMRLYAKIKWKKKENSAALKRPANNGRPPSPGGFFICTTKGQAVKRAPATTLIRSTQSDRRPRWAKQKIRSGAKTSKRIFTLRREFSNKTRRKSWKNC